MLQDTAYIDEESDNADKRMVEMFHHATDNDSKLSKIIDLFYVIQCTDVALTFSFKQCFVCVL